MKLLVILNSFKIVILSAQSKSLMTLSFRPSNERNFLMFLIFLVRSNQFKSQFLLMRVVKLSNERPKVPKKSVKKVSPSFPLTPLNELTVRAISGRR